MAGASVSEMILFIAALVVAASVAGTLTAQVDRVSDSISARSLDVSNEIRADITVVSDSGATVYDRNGNGNVTLYVRNTGSSNLPAEARSFDVLMNGTYVTDVSVTVVKGGPGWSRGGVVNVSFTAGSGLSGDQRVKLIVREDEERFKFRV